MVESGRVPGKGSIRRSIEKTVSANTDMGSNQCEYQKMVESRRVTGKCRMRASIEKVSRRVPEKGRICVSTEKWYNPGEYRENVEYVRVSKKCPDEHRKMVESV